MNQGKLKAVITILGIQGGYVKKQTKEVVFTNFENKAEYFFENESEKKEYFNTLPFLSQEFSSYKLVPIFTEDAKIFNEEVINKAYKNINIQFEDSCFIKDDKDFENIFKIFNETIEQYDELIIDVSHGFRHLPILMIVDLIIQNFQNTEKIQKILFAKEIKKHEKEQKGLYEIIDLKEYLDLANISFILTTFEKNYTVASHIKSKKYEKLLKELNDFSNDLMALNIGNLSKTSQELICELDKIENISIKNQAQNLKKVIKELCNFEGKKRYLTYYELSKNLFDKNYMLLSLALLYESIRMYIKTHIKKQHKNLVEDIEKHFKGDLYKIGDFFKNLKWKTYEQLQKDKRKPNISDMNYKKLQKAFPLGNFKNLYDAIDDKRNNLAHANTKGSFLDIKKDISLLLFKYESLVIKK